MLGGMAAGRGGARAAKDLLVKVEGITTGRRNLGREAMVGNGDGLDERGEKMGGGDLS